MTFKVLFFFLFTILLFTQEKIYVGKQAEKLNKLAEEFRVRKGEKTPSFIKFNESIDRFSSKEKLLGLNDDYKMTKTKTFTILM